MLFSSCCHSRIGLGMNQFHDILCGRIISACRATFIDLISTYPSRNGRGLRCDSNSGVSGNLVRGGQHGKRGSATARAYWILGA
jgi:hypothetical protein